MLLDVAAGIIGAILAWGYGGLPPAAFVLVGILCALLPDADVFLSLLRSGRGGKYAHEHRNFLHYPLIYAGGGGVVLWLISPRVALLFISLSLFHFLHDSVGIGWGVRWLYPFSPDYFKFFSDRENNFSSNFLVRWTPAELSVAVEHYGKNDWLTKYYLRPHPVGIVEGIIFLITIAYVLLRYLR